MVAKTSGTTGILDLFLVRTIPRESNDARAEASDLERSHAGGEGSLRVNIVSKSLDQNSLVPALQFKMKAAHLIHKTVLIHLFSIPRHTTTPYHSSCNCVWTAHLFLFSLRIADQLYDASYKVIYVYMQVIRLLMQVIRLFMYVISSFIPNPVRTKSA